MPTSRPTSGVVTTVGVLHLVGAGLGLILSLCAGVNTFGYSMMPNMPANGNPTIILESQLINTIPTYLPVLIGTVAGGFIFDVVLLVAGIGLLMRKAWGRYATIFYGVTSLLFKLVLVVYYVAVVTPAANSILDRAPNLPPVGPERTGFMFGAVYAAPCFRAFLALYPLAVLLLMFMPGVVAALSEPRRRSPRDEDEDDYRDRDDEDDRDDRRRYRDHDGRRYRDDDYDR